MTGKLPKISAIIIINPNWFNDLKFLLNSLRSVNFVDEIILIPSKNHPQINKIAVKFKAKIVEQQGGKFADWRNLGTQKANGEWLFYIDADEQCPDILAQEIINIT